MILCLLHVFSFFSFFLSFSLSAYLFVCLSLYALNSKSGNTSLYFTVLHLSLSLFLFILYFYFRIIIFYVISFFSMPGQYALSVVWGGPDGSCNAIHHLINVINGSYFIDEMHMGFSMDEASGRKVVKSGIYRYKFVVNSMLSRVHRAYCDTASSHLYQVGGSLPKSRPQRAEDRSFAHNASARGYESLINVNRECVLHKSCWQHFTRRKDLFSFPSLPFLSIVFLSLSFPFLFIVYSFLLLDN